MLFLFENGGAVLTTWHGTVTYQLTFDTSWEKARPVNPWRKKFFTDTFGYRSYGSRHTDLLIENVLEVAKDYTEMFHLVDSILADEGTSESELYQDVFKYLSGLMILNPGPVYQDFIEAFEGREPASYPAWAIVADSGDWDESTVPSLLTMPTEHMERYLLEHEAGVSTTSILEVVSKRSDYLGLPVEWLRQAYMTTQEENAKLYD